MSAPEEDSAEGNRSIKCIVVRVTKITSHAPTPPLSEPPARNLPQDMIVSCNGGTPRHHFLRVDLFKRAKNESETLILIPNPVEELLSKTPQNDYLTDVGGTQVPIKFCPFPPGSSLNDIPISRI